MPPSLVPQAVDPGFGVLADARASETSAKEARRHDLETPEGAQLGLQAAPVTGEARAQILKFPNLFATHALLATGI